MPKVGPARPLLLDEEPELLDPLPLEPLEPVPDGAEVTVPVPCAPAWPIKDAQVPVGLT